MKSRLRRRLGTWALVLTVVCVGAVLGGNVVVKDGAIDADSTVEGLNFKTGGCTASGTKAVAFGNSTTASGACSTAMGMYTGASGGYSTAMGYYSAGYGTASAGIGYYAGAIGNYTRAIGKNTSNYVQDSFTVGYGGVDLRVESDVVTMYDDVYVHGELSAEDVIDRSSFYDKDKYGAALGHVVDSSQTIKVNGQGEKEYDHEADPVFVQRSITVKDYDKYTEEEVWNDELEIYEIRRIYETHDELGSSLSAKVAWLAQCVFELKQENEMLKAELAKVKAALGIE